MSSEVNRYRLDKLFEITQGYKSMIYTIDYRGRILLLVTGEDEEQAYLGNITYELYQYDGTLYKLCDIKSSIVFHFISRFCEDKVLLSNARARFNKGNPERNCCIYNSYSGELINNFLLGDGIEQVKVDSKQKIWVSYFDEGIIGNYGWKTPIGKNGLAIFNSRGELISQGRGILFGVNFNVCSREFRLSYRHELGFKSSRATYIELIRGEEVRIISFPKPLRVTAAWKNFFLEPIIKDDELQVRFKIYTISKSDEISLYKIIEIEDFFEAISQPIYVEYNGQYLALYCGNNFFLADLAKFV